MDSRQPELSRLTLMCSDHEVAEFTWNHDRQAVTGKTHVLDAAHAPLMATDPSGNITRDRLSSWFKASRRRPATSSSATRSSPTCAAESTKSGKRSTCAP